MLSEELAKEMVDEACAMKETEVLERVRKAIEKEIVGGPIEVYEMKIRLLKELKLS